MIAIYLPSDSGASGNWIREVSSPVGFWSRMKWSDWINEEGEIMNAQDTTTAFFNRLKAREEGASGDFFRYVED